MPGTFGGSIYSTVEDLYRFYRGNGRVRFHAQEGHLFDGGSWLIPAGGNTFIHRTYWSTLTFERDAGGEVTRLLYDSFVGEKVR